MIPGVVMMNGGSVGLGQVPLLPVMEFRKAVLDGVEEGARVSSMFAYSSAGDTRIYVVLSSAATGQLFAFSTIPGGEMESLTPHCPQVHLFEREIAEEQGIRFIGHPWPKPVRLAAGHKSAEREAEFFRIEGEEIHEVAVGPVHAGIIEPGHFRFQCHGEMVQHLEISLGYQHRGIERMLPASGAALRMHLIETLSGDSTIGHATAYCSALEGLGGTDVPARAQVMRGVALELERLANHVGDLGALSGDIGFLPTMSYCGRIRGDILNLTAVLCGNRFGRGLVRPGGLGFDAGRAEADTITARLPLIMRDAESAVSLLWDNPSVLSRFEGTGTVDRRTATEIGLVGPAARASGIETDARHDLPSGIYRMVHIPMSVWDSGDVLGRALVRWMEIQRSAAFVLEQLASLPGGEAAVTPGPMRADAMSVSVVEGWRGAICHAVLTDGQGRLWQARVTDPSFHNWFGLACVMRNQQISDFPLCNKSFNLSYCGHDL
jgi:Ni,Fe-hydrogenase III large subunit